eukprot:gb/GEZN01006189.1/.p1 GENE.gb/GEZN01006189.1/~~gb/GEZN01006189.1/.p1  ORF type:complete len:404 (+),score=91.49 gb/GEZN01006189.1/:218-1429(+)
MSNLRNIGGDQGDKFFRYKMPDLMSKVEKPNTNGQQTVILNIAEISKALKINPEYPTRFFGYELGAQATFMDTSDRTCAILKGIHQPLELRKLLEKFIQMFILCPTCKLPETKLSCRRKNVVATCASCGYDGPLNHGHKLENWIATNLGTKKPKDKGNKKKGKKSKKGKEEEKEEEANGQDAPAEEPETVPEVEEEEVAPKPTKLSWTVDVSEEAQERRRRELIEQELADEKARSKLARIGKIDTSKPEEVLRAYVQESNRQVHEVVSELERLRMSHELSSQEKWRVMLEGLLDITKPKTLSKQIKVQAKNFQAVADSPTSKLLLITSAIRFLQAGQLQRMPIVLQAFHEHDVLDDASIISWHESPPETDAAAVGKDVAIQARKESKFFIDWLQREDEESDDE